MKANTVFFTLLILLACNNSNDKKTENGKYQSATLQDRQAMAKDFCDCTHTIELTPQAQQVVNAAAMSTTPNDEVIKQLELLRNNDRVYTSVKISVEKITTKNTKNIVTPCMEKLKATYGNKLNETSMMFGLDMTNELLKIDCVLPAAIIRLWLNTK